MEERNMEDWKGRKKEGREEKTHKNHVISARGMLGLQAKDNFTHDADQPLLIKSI